MKHSQNHTFFAVLLIIPLIFSACAQASTAEVTPVEVVDTLTEATMQVATNEATATPSDEQIIPDQERIPLADAALAFGDYDQALQAYTTFANTTTDPAEKAAALFGISLTHFKTENFPLALSTARELISAFPQEIPAIRANLLLAWTFNALDRKEEALDSYQKYLELNPAVIDAYVYEQIGDLFIEKVNYTEALSAYQSAYLSPQNGSNENLAIKIANTYASLQEKQTAISLYKDIYFNTNSDYTKAQMDIALANVYLIHGNMELAYEDYQDAVENYPFTYDAYTALVELVNNGEAVNELKRGIINANIGQYDLAIEAYNRYLSQEDANIATGLYYKALATRALGIKTAPLGSALRSEANQTGGIAEDVQAIALWQEITSQYPNSEFAVDAWEDIAYTQSAYMADPVAAALTAKDFVANAPDSPFSSNILFTAGRYFEIAGELRQAAETWSRLATEYPNTNETFQAIFFAGISYYRLQEMENALLAFNRAVVLSLDPLETSAAYLWIGKVNREQGVMDAGNDALRQAKVADPFGYYGIRADEILNEQTPFTQSINLNTSIDLEEERETAADWLKINFLVPDDVDLSQMESLADDPGFVRGQEFWALGKFVLAKNEFEALRVANKNDPVVTFQLIDTLLEVGLYRTAIESTKSILAAAGINFEDVTAYPAYFGHIIYGLYYLPWISDAIATKEIPLLYIYSLINQESHFEGFIESSAGARGLMQILPQTGAQIASEINFPADFEADDLSIPYINLVLGSNYLNRQIYLFDGDLYAAAAAYNGGPGSALEWKEIAGNDPDLFVGVIRFLETRTYIRQIVEIYSAYSKLYSN